MGRRVSLNVIEIDDPCVEDWSQMTGSGAVRYCHLCKLNVYDLSEMDAEQAATLLETTEGRLCVTFYERADGTVVTKDCTPMRFAAVRRAAKRSLAVASTLVAGVLAFAVGIGTLFSGEKEPCSYTFATKDHVHPGPPMVPNPEVVEAPERDIDWRRRRGGMRRHRPDRVPRSPTSSGVIVTDPGF